MLCVYVHHCLGDQRIRTFNNELLLLKFQVLIDLLLIIKLCSFIFLVTPISKSEESKLPLESQADAQRLLMQQQQQAQQQQQQQAQQQQQMAAGMQLSHGHHPSHNAALQQQMQQQGLIQNSY